MCKNINNKQKKGKIMERRFKRCGDEMIIKSQVLTCNRKVIGHGKIENNKITNFKTRKIMKKSLIFSVLFAFLATIEINAEEVKNDSISFPGGYYRGEYVGEGTKQGTGTYQLGEHFAVLGKWDSDHLLDGAGVVFRGGKAYGFTYKKDTDSKNVATIYVGDQEISTEVFTENPGGEDLYERLWDNIVLGDRKARSEMYKKYMNGKVFYINVSFDDYLPLNKAGEAGQRARSLFDKNMQIFSYIIPIDENRLLYGQFMYPKSLERTDRGYLLQQSMLMKELSELSIYDYRVNGDSLIFDGSTTLSPGYCVFKNGKLYLGPQQIVMTSGSKGVAGSVIEKQTKTDIAKLMEKAENKSTLDEDDYLSIEELKEKYKTDLEDSYPKLGITSEEFGEYIRKYILSSSYLSDVGGWYKVKVGVLISRTGEIKKKYVIESSDDNPYAIKNSLFCIEKLPNFKPAVRNGQFVECEVVIPLSFGYR